MAVIVKVQAQWNNFQGAPGYTNWYGMSDGDAAAAANALGPRMRTFFDAVKAHLPTGVTVKVQRTYQVLDSITGNLTSEANLSADPAVVTGTGTGTYSAPAGAVVNWETGAFNDLGHRVRGRTYLVPLANAYDTDGTLSAAAVTTIGNAATAALGGTGSLLTFSRPVKANPAKGITARIGQINLVTAASLHDKACVLRSRRD
jgi:hypothetical protein